MVYKSQNTKKAGILGAIVAAHIAIGILVMATKTVAPQFFEMPLTVDLLPSPPLETKAKPLPMIKPQTATKATPPHPPQPTLEATNSTLSTPQAPFASNPEDKTLVAATTAEPVTSASFDADYLKNPAPSYPTASRRMGEEGKVILRVQVNTLGAPEQVEVKSSSGSSRLDDAALQTVRTWKFIPAKRGETPIESWVMVPINFKIEH